MGPAREDKNLKSEIFKSDFLNLRSSRATAYGGDGQAPETSAVAPGQNSSADITLRKELKSAGGKALNHNGVQKRGIRTD